MGITWNHAHMWEYLPRSPQTCGLLPVSDIRFAVDKKGITFGWNLRIFELIPYFGYRVFDHPYMGVVENWLSDHCSNNCAYSPQARAVFHSFYRLIHSSKEFLETLSKQESPYLGMVLDVLECTW